MIRRGLLSDYFEGVAVKQLSAVEANVLRSNQHEFNSSRQLKQLLGTPDREEYPARFIWLGGEQEAITEEGFLTWYQSRKPPRSEWRLYFPTNPVVSSAAERDTLFLAKMRNRSLMAIIVPSNNSTMFNQLMWLFGLDRQSSDLFLQQDIARSNAPELDFTVRYILDELGVEPEEPEADKLDSLVAKFGAKFPTTREFSLLARNSVPEASPLEAPDETLLAWMEREEQLFRRLERRIVDARLHCGFVVDNGADVDGFLKFSLSVQNRRKSRAGFALENHLEAIFLAHDIRFVRGAETENGNVPDFLFPGQAEYRNPRFPTARLTMLASKSTLKDRWRQVLSEAGRINHKHLVTLEPSVSENQTDEMRTKQLQLVLPARLHGTYNERQRAWLMELRDFIGLVRGRQAD